MEFPIERFLEVVRQYPFLYDKTKPEYKDTEAKMNRWHLIGKEFAITGHQAMMKFRHARDRWNKIRTEQDQTARSGAGGSAAKTPKWALYSIVDSILRGTAHYSERASNNIPEAEQRSMLRCSVSTPLHEGDPSDESTAQALFSQMEPEDSELYYDGDIECSFVEQGWSASPAVVICGNPGRLAKGR
ncbi:uncharacterized protein [Dermacentor albipictus]|uniref:uncharacterized protein isoform X2 n=1 Tax=Dermacentor albipictus TaxID=60249 RepID=UPI0038FC339A